MRYIRHIDEGCAHFKQHKWKTFKLLENTKKNIPYEQLSSTKVHNMQTNVVTEKRKS